MADPRSTETEPGVTPARSEREIRELVRSLIVEYSPSSDAAELPLDDAHLVDDLEYHSLALIELSFTLEDEFDLKPIDEAAAQQIMTVRDIEKYVVREVCGNRNPEKHPHRG